jgi:ABC-type sugar transport system ATPase subunit
MSAPPPLLSCQGLEAGYGASQVLFGIHLQIAAGEVVSLLGRNGMGKSTTIKALVGALRPTAGSIHFAGQIHGALAVRCDRPPGPGHRARGAPVFPNLTVREHLVAFADRRNGLSDVWTWSASTACSRASKSGSTTWAASSRAASSRCWPLAARCLPTRGCSSSTRPPRGWPP